jgi:hypothetical protein
MSVAELRVKPGLANEEQDKKEKHCDEVGAALDQGTLGEMVAKHEKLILKYYEDVQRQASQSFELAQQIAWWGFFVLVGSLVAAFRNGNKCDG